jgi:hypothetical protein
MKGDLYYKLGVEEILNGGEKLVCENFFLKKPLPYKIERQGL